MGWVLSGGSLCDFVGCVWGVEGYILIGVGSWGWGKWGGGKQRCVKRSGIEDSGLKV